jgi:NAD(P)-dependent dehydrogenase (short-subunit alcohol dehydrogenase family)
VSGSPASRRVAFITGASSGLGAGLAQRLACEGYDVGLAARREQPLEEIAATIRAGGGEALALPCDVTDREAVRAAIERCRDELGPLDLLICNAGISEMTEVETFDATDVERVMAVNFFGAVFAIDAVLHSMRQRGAGHLVGVGSLAGYRGLPRTAAYSASKGALHNLFESLRVDLRGSGVDVTFITPGYVATPMTEVNEHPMPFLVGADDAVERMTRAILLKRRLLAFPRPLSTLVRVGQLFPAGFYDWLASRHRRDKRTQGEP